MLLEIYILMEIIVFGLFIASFFTRQEILWVLTMAISGIMMVSSYTVEIVGYVYNSATAAYVLETSTFYYPYLMGINLLIFGLALVFGIFDIWDKFGQGMVKGMQ
jgi:hypothetical protein